jgi:hypothetical protein
LLPTGKAVIFSPISFNLSKGRPVLNDSYAFIWEISAQDSVIQSSALYLRLLLFM